MSILTTFPVSKISLSFSTRIPAPLSTGAKPLPAVPTRTEASPPVAAAIS